MKLTKLALRVLSILFPIIVYIIYKKIIRGIILHAIMILLPIIMYSIAAYTFQHTLNLSDLTTLADWFSGIGALASLGFRVWVSIEAWEMVTDDFANSSRKQPTKPDNQ